jgi:hypothetical protein
VYIELSHGSGMSIDLGELIDVSSGDNLNLPLILEVIDGALRVDHREKEGGECDNLHGGSSNLSNDIDVCNLLRNCENDESCQRGANFGESPLDLIIAVRCDFPFSIYFV